MKNVRHYAIIGILLLISYGSTEPHLIPQKENHNFYFDVDYLAWKAQEDQTQYAVLLPGGVPDPNTVNFTLKPKVINQCFKFDSGVQVTAGYTWCEDWDVWFNWSHFHPKSCSGVESTDSTGIIAILLADPGISGEVTNFSTQANSNWNLHYDFFNLDLGKIITLCSNGFIETSFGFAATRIKQYQTVSYANVTIDGATNPQTVNSLRCNAFKAAGLHAAADISWNLGCSIDLIGSASAALLVGTFNTSTNNYFVNDKKTISAATCAHRVRPLFDINLGLAWHSDYFKCADVGLHVLFEAIYTPDQWQAPSSLVSLVTGYLPGGGDLTMYGVTIGLDFAF